MDRNPRRQKLIWSNMVPFGVNSDPSFRAQKLRIRVRVSSFRTAETVMYDEYFRVMSTHDALCQDA